jgi:hypothetical protein
MHDRPLRDDEYDETEDRPIYRPDPDLISEGVGSPAFYQHYTLTECQERFEHPSLRRHPEVFDRYYPMAPTGRVLIDIIGSSSPEQTAQDRARKRCEFKAAWAAEHDYRYLALLESDLTPNRIRALLALPTPGSEENPVVVKVEATESTKSTRKAPARGKVQRPKAAA